MHGRFYAYGAAVLVLSLLITACEHDGASGGLGPTASGVVQTALLTVEPARIVPAFLPERFCPVRPAFRADLTLFVRAIRSLVIRGVVFDFVDRFGNRTTPRVVPTAGTGATVPTSIPVPIPSSPAIPIPRTVPFHGVPVAPDDVRTLPVSLFFECGVGAAGTLLINVDMADERGRSHVSQIEVRIDG